MIAYLRSKWCQYFHRRYYYPVMWQTDHERGYGTVCRKCKRLVAVLHREPTTCRCEDGECEH